MFLSYALGKPTATVDPDKLDIDEWHRLQNSPTEEDWLNLIILERANPRLAELFRVLCPGGIESIQYRHRMRHDASGSPSLLRTTRRRTTNWTTKATEGPARCGPAEQNGNVLWPRRRTRPENRGRRRGRSQKGTALMADQLGPLANERLRYFAEAAEVPPSVFEHLPADSNFLDWQKAAHAAGYRKFSSCVSTRGSLPCGVSVRRGSRGQRQEETCAAKPRPTARLAGFVSRKAPPPHVSGFARRMPATSVRTHRRFGNDQPHRRPCRPSDGTALERHSDDGWNRSNNALFFPLE